jgi:hypothetical protein
MNIDEISTKTESDIVIIKAVAIKYQHSIKQLLFFLKQLKDESIVVFLFHSIMYEKDIRRKNKWIFSAEKFEDLLKIFKKMQDVKILNIRELLYNNQLKKQNQ